MSEYVLDASALLAILNQEPNTNAWSHTVSTGAISTVNLCEVITKLTDASMSGADIRRALGMLGMDIVPFDHELAFSAGLLRVETKEFGLSLGDRACLALGIRLGVPTLTTDRAWGQLRVGAMIHILR